MRVEDWGLIHYNEANRRQLEAVDAVASGSEEILILCSHPPVVTVGRATTADDITSWSGETIETSRGGRATYHGPSQLVVYPLIDLKRPRPGVPERDVHAYLRAIEAATVAALHELGLSGAEARTTLQGGQSLTGVWVGDKKIASIGIAVKKWVTYHGMAVNVSHDPGAFHGINPCGFKRDVMTSLERQIGRPVRPSVAAFVFARQFKLALARPTAGSRPNWTRSPSLQK
jgi:lipoyl(octanoyl) transferase